MKYITCKSVSKSNVFSQRLSLFYNTLKEKFGRKCMKNLTAANCQMKLGIIWRDRQMKTQIV